MSTKGRYTLKHLRDEARELASHILYPRFDSTPARLEALARRIHDATCEECDLCTACGRNMTEGEPHTAECPSALAQDAVERGGACTCDRDDVDLLGHLRGCPAA